MPSDVRPSGPWTVLSALKWTSEYFGRNHIESPRVDAEILLAHVLGFRRIDLYLRFDQPLEAHELDRFRDLIRRRIRREPVAYITGEKEFWSLGFKVDRSVLIPRPETELLVEQALKFAAPHEGEARVRVLELGTGSGAISVALAHEREDFSIAATDVSFEALCVARENAGRHRVQERIMFLGCRWFGAVKPGRGFDLVVSNPPYISSRDLGELQPEIRDFEPRQALDGGEDGLKEVSEIVASAPDYLKPGGFLILEIGADQHSAVEAAAWQCFAYKEVETVKDYSGRFRVARMRRK